MICPEASNLICYDLQTITRLSSGCRSWHSECIFNNFLVSWDMVALDESDIEHRLIQNGTSCRRRSVSKILSRNCRAVAKLKTVFSNILVI